MSEKNLMQKIADSNKSVISGVDDLDIELWIKIYFLGREYRVPAGLTIMQALEYAGYFLTRSCGCRAGFCGACSTVYRIKGEYKLQFAMACQAEAMDGMYLVQLPFAPAEKRVYSLDHEEYSANTLLKYYPEIARCLSCNTCTKSCPQGIEVMDYINAALRGDYKQVAELSFDCIQCGLCAIRCPADIVHYNVAQLARRLYGKYGMPQVKNLNERATEIEEGVYQGEFDHLVALSNDELKKLYVEQQKNKEVY